MSGCRLLHEGEEWRGKPRLAATVRLFSAAFFRKVITRHDTGMGESYMDDDWEVRNRTLIGRDADKVSDCSSDCRGVLTDRAT